MAALEENELFPQSVSGSSAGALVAALWASGNSAQDMRSLLANVTKKDFWDPGFGFGLLKGNVFSKTLDSFLVATTFETCRWPLAVSVFDVKTLRTHVVCTGEINSAVRASCAYPGLFHPVRVNGLFAIDGGVLDRSGLAATEPGTRVLYHHLPSRSRWRGHIKRLSGVPRRDNLRAVIPTGLPKLSPLDFSAGMNAFQLAREHTLKVLDEPYAPPV